MKCVFIFACVFITPLMCAHGQTLASAGYSFGTKILKIQPTKQWKPAGISRQIESVGSYSVSFGFARTNMEYGGKYGFIIAHLNRSYSSHGNPIQSVVYHSIGGYTKFYFSKNRRVIPLLFLESGGLIHYPKELGLFEATYHSKVYFVSGIGVRLGISSHLKTEVVLTTGHTLVNFNLLYLLKQ